MVFVRTKYQGRKQPGHNIKLGRWLDVCCSSSLATATTAAIHAEVRVSDANLYGTTEAAGSAATVEFQGCLYNNNRALAGPSAINNGIKGPAT